MSQTDPLRWRELAAVAAVLALATLLLFVTAPHNGEFWWSDAPRHALNGAFLKDFIAEHPFADPTRWAMQYYSKYPALTILFYPPLFYVILVPFYAVFGVSNATALAVVLLHFFAFALGLYVWARRWLTPVVAALAALAAMAAPGIAEWGRQVMLEIPSLAYAVWAMVLLRAYTATGRPLPLYFGAFLLVCSLYTKLNIVVLLPVAAVMVLAGRGSRMWRDRHVWIAVVLTVIGLIPLVWLTLHFGAANVQSVAGVPNEVVPRDRIDGWIWYALNLPPELGWPLVLGACLWPIAVLLRPRGKPSLDWPDRVLLLGWLIVSYLFLSSVSLKMGRYATQFMPPLVIIAMLAVARLLPQRAIAPAAALLVVATVWQTAATAPVPFVSGYREAALWINKEVPPDAVVMFAGVRDGSFIFNMRTLPRRDITTLRADKLLLEIAVQRELGVVQHDLSEAEISAELDRLGVSYVVAQDNFWPDIPVLVRFDSVLHSAQFAEVTKIPIVSNVKTEDAMVRIYRNLHPIPPGPHQIDLRLPIIGQSVKGTVGR